MIIKRLELQGFKSFPERTKIVFHPGITAIVGPNGTGKSNIVDAILWVLGGQRQKALRGEKAEDIIFNGNNKRPALSLAEVVMTLEEGEEQLAISHRLFRSGEGEYRLNGKPVRLKDIQNTLWKREVAEKEYFIIEQGSIGHLLTSKPQEKRQLLEEAAGTAFYKEKKKQAQSKLENSEQNLTRLEDIIAEVTRAKNSLARQAAVARRYRQLRERRRELRSLLYLKKLNNFEQKRKEIAKAHQQCLEEENDCLSKIKAAEKELSCLRSKLWELGKWLESAREELHSLENQRQKLETEKKTSRLEFLEERKEKAKEEIKQLEEERHVLNQELNLLKTVEEELGQSFKEKQFSLKQAKGEWEESENRRRQLISTLQQIRDEHLQKISRLTEAKNEVSRLEKEMEFSLKQENKLRAQIEKAEENLLRIKTRINQLQMEIQEEEKEKNLREEKIQTKIKQLEELAIEHKEIQIKIEEKQKKKDALSYEIQAIARLCQQSSQKPPLEISGGLGRLLDLLRVDPGFGRFADIFLGEASQALALPAEAIVNEPTPEIKGPVFLLASPGSHPKHDLPSHPEIVCFLKSRLHPQEPLKARWAEFPEAIIVKNLKTAVELWLKYPDFNFITLKEEVLFSTGFLKVGEKSEGLFALQEEWQRREEELAQIDQELKPWQEKLAEIEEESQRIQTHLNEESEEIHFLEKKLKELDRDISRLKLEEAQLEQNRDLFSKEVNLLLGERQTFQPQLQQARQEVNRFESEEAKTKEKIISLEKSLVAEEERVKEQAQKVIEFKALLEIDEEKKRHLSRQAENLKQRLLEVNQKIQNLHQQLEFREKEERELRQNLMVLKEEIRSLNISVEKKRHEIGEQENQYTNLRQENEFREKELADLRNAYENHKEERIRQEIARTEVERDWANLEENCWQELRKTLSELHVEAPQKEMFNGEIEAELEQAEEELQKFKAVNLMAEEEYQQQKERYNFLIAQRNDLRDSIQAAREAIQKIDEESKNQFLQALDLVNRNFQEVFTFLFRGGTAEVRLTDSSNPLESGAEIMAQPPGKRLQNINLLSGGEKSLTSLAFLFALFRTRPTPFCILDEVDAALDENNISRFLDLMEKMKPNTQFIIITHNYKTMEVVDYIYGTTMEEPNVTRLYSVRLEKKSEAPTLS